MKKTLTESEKIAALTNHLDGWREPVMIDKLIEVSHDGNVEKLLQAHPELFRAVSDRDGVVGWSLTKDSQHDIIQGKVINQFIFDDSEIIRPGTFCMSKLGPELFSYGLFLPKEVPEKNRDGETIGTTQIQQPVLITSDGRLLEAQKSLEKDFKVRIETPYGLPLRWSLKSLKRYLDGQAQAIDARQLFDKVRSQYERFLYYRNPVWYDVHALWDIGSYFFMLFNAYPLFELRGVQGSAKSKTMEVSQRITLNASDIMINPSEATLFRDTHELRPTKYIDEAEKLFPFNPKTKQVEPDLRAELINSSYSRGGVVPRQEKVGNRFMTVRYHTYSPTMIGSIRGLHGATEDRAISHISVKAPDKDARGELEVKDSDNEPTWQEIRDSLYLFGLQNWKAVEELYRNFGEETGIKRRDFQLWKPLLALAKLVGQDVYERVKKFAIDLSEQKKLDFIPEGSVDYIILKFLHARVKDLDDPLKRTYVKDIREDVKFDLPELKERTLSSRLDNLGFKELRGKDREGSYFTITRSIFESIVNTLAPKIIEYSEIDKKSSQSSLSSQLDSNDVTISDE